MRRLPATVLVSLLSLGAVASTAHARVKLAAQPERERVEIQLDDGLRTLVEEERIVPLLASTPALGNNFVDFSWSNARIEKDSIQLRPLAIRAGDGFRPLGLVNGKPEVAVVNVAYPPSENALVWEVYAHDACALKVRVSYFIASLDRTFAYRALADRGEAFLSLKAYVLLRNGSGEDFGSADVGFGFGSRFLKPVGDQEETKMLLERFEKVPVRKTYGFDWYRHGPLSADKPYASRILMHYELRNDRAHGLGAFALQPGKVRIFVEDGHGGEAFLGEDVAEPTPLDGRLRLFLGEARDVVCTRTVQGNVRRPLSGNLFDQEVRLRYEIESFKDGPVTLDVVEQVNELAAELGARARGDVEWVLGPDTTPGLRWTTERGGALPELHVDLPARPAGKADKVPKTTVVLHLVLKNLW